MYKYKYDGCKWGDLDLCFGGYCDGDSPVTYRVLYYVSQHVLRLDAFVVTSRRFRASTSIYSSYLYIPIHYLEIQRQYATKLL
jgi:hypothetical protein